MTEKQCDTFWAKIYLSGDINVAKQICREFCMTGLCVTINQTLFIYTGGEEFGIEVGLINYPRFETKEEGLLSKAIELGGKLRDGLFQHSYLVMTPSKTIWNSSRKTEN